MEEETVEEEDTDEEEGTKEETEPEITVEEGKDEAKEVTEEPKVSKEVGIFKREMHNAVCADCGKKCEVPFKPTEGRPVYCRDCYRKHIPQRRRF